MIGDNNGEAKHRGFPSLIARTSPEQRTEGAVTEVELTEHTLIIHVKGADKIWSMKSKLEIPLSHVLGAKVDPAVTADWEELINSGVMNVSKK
jgi:hypothetical protein